MSWYDWRPYVPVAERRRRAERKLAALKKKGRTASPVTIDGRVIAKTFWGKSWCENLERYSDYANRLPRGRTYVRNGSVVDLQIAKGEVRALVAGSALYTVKIGIAPVPDRRWKDICRNCAGSVGSLVELLQGRFDKSVMDRVCREGDGLFPSPREIELSCSCPDWASMCKHVAAVLYGVGARLDESPRLLFTLRDVDEGDMLAGVGSGLALAQPVPGSAKVLDDGDAAALFGLDMAETDAGAPAAGATRKKEPRTGKRKDRAGAKGASAVKAKSGPGRAARAKAPGKALRPRGARTGARRQP